MFAALGMNWKMNWLFAQWSHTWGVGLFGQNFLLLFFCFYNVPYICEG